MSEQEQIDSMLRSQIETLERNMNRRLDATDASVNRRFDTQDSSLKRIEGKVDKTNGRVTVLEKARERAQGVIFAFKWLPSVLTAGVTAGLTILMMALTGAIK